MALAGCEVAEPVLSLVAWREGIPGGHFGDATLVRRVYTGEFFPALEDALVNEVRRARANDPLRPIDLLVGSNLLGIQLRRRLARRLGALAAVTPLTFLDLARRWAEPSLRGARFTPVPPFGDDVLIRRVIAELPSNGYFEPVRRYAGFRSALLGTIRDLKDAGWDAARLRSALSRAGLGADSDRKIRQLAAIVEAYERLNARGRLYDRSDLLADAARLAGARSGGREDGGWDERGDPPAAGTWAKGAGRGSSPPDRHRGLPARQLPLLFEENRGADVAGRQDLDRSLREHPETPHSESGSGAVAARRLGPSPSPPGAAASGSGSGSGSSRASGDSPLLLAYGFYDLIELQWRLLEAESRARDTIVFVPTTEAAAFGFAVELLEKLEAAGFERRPVDARPGVNREREPALSPPSGWPRPRTPALEDFVARLDGASGSGGPPLRESATGEPPVGSESKSGGRSVRGAASSQPHGRPGAAFGESSLGNEPESAALSIRRGSETQSLGRFGSARGEPPVGGESGSGDPLAPGGSAPEGPPIRVVSAPGPAREAAEIARQVLAWAGEGIRFHEMAVLVRASEPYLTDIERALARASVPYVRAGGSPMRFTRAARAAKRLLAIPASDWGRPEVLSFLSIADLKPLAHDTDDTEVAPAEWEPLTVAAGLVGGEEQWKAALDRTISALRGRIKKLETSLGAPAGGTAPAAEVREDAVELEADLFLARRRLQAARSLLHVWRRLVRAIGVWPESGRWGACAAGFAACLRELLRETPEREELAALVEGLARLEPAGPCPDRATFIDVLTDAIEARGVGAGRFERDGVLLAPVDAARGLTFRAVAVAGLAERVFPMLGHEDPVLLDTERERLTARGAGRLPRAGGRLSEERMLFRLAVGSATDRLAFTWSRVLPGQDRDCPPSPFVREVLGALQGPEAHHVPGQPARPSRAAAGAFSSEVTGWADAFHEIPLLPLASGPMAQSIDRAEWNVQRALRTRMEAAPEIWSPATLAPEHRDLLGPLELERSRWSLRAFGPFDGWLDVGAADRAANAFLGTSLSPTRLEAYAGCPLKAFFGYVLRVRPMRDPADAETIDPLERGSLVHAILAEFLGALAQESSDRRARLDRADKAILAERLHETAGRHLARAGETATVGYPLMWRVEQERMLEALDRWLDLEIDRAAASEMRPALFEWSFGSARGSEASPALLELSDGSPMRFHGRIDRIDLDPSGRRARVIDYKSGRKPEGGPLAAPLPAQLALARSSQLPLYMMAARGAGPSDDPAPLTVVSSEFMYLRDGVQVAMSQSDWEHARAAFSHAVEALVQSVRGGDFTGDPRDDMQCKMCDFREPCGPGRLRTFGRKKADPRIAARLALGRVTIEDEDTQT